VAGAAGFAADEVAGGFVRRGQKLIVQACRVDSAAARAQLTTSFSPLTRSKERPKMVRVATPHPSDVTLMQDVGLDLTEHGGPGFMDVVLHDARDEDLLRAAGLDFKVLVADMRAANAAARAADKANYGTRSALPSGRTSYRFLEDYENDMKRLAQENPDLVRPITLPEKTLEGRTVQGIEIASRVHRSDDGRPVFVMVGVHHAREWPSSEHTMEWAFELIDGYGRNADVTRLVDSVRMILVPVVNVDGFNLSRRAGTDGTAHDLKRKNCRLLPTDTLKCVQLATTRGVDPNRNYGGLWGGVGASTTAGSETYRGAGPFSEPETRNVRWLVSTRHATNLITNHTHGGLILRPPGVAAQGWAPDEAAMKDLGDRMASHNGYTSQYSWQLYDTNGTTEDHSYSSTGGYGYTFEIGTGGAFHAAYQAHVIDEYLGAGSARGAGKGGNRAAYFEAMEETADTAHHSVITGRTSGSGRTLELTKAFKTSTAPVLNTAGVPGQVIRFDDAIETALTVPRSRTFEWHVNPSTRPEVRGGRWKKGEPTPGFVLAPSRPVTTPTVRLAPLLTVSGAGTVPPSEVTVDTPLSYQDFPFTVTPAQDNGYMRARIDWTAADNWDLEFFRRNPDGTLTMIARSVNSTTSSRKFEELQSVHVSPGDYVVRVRNIQALNDPDGFTGSVQFFSPEPPEAYTLTCRERDGRVRRVSQVYVGRGERVDVGDPCRARG
jgi:hypothetical protein